MTTDSTPPKVQLELASPKFRIDDFFRRNWSLFTGQTVATHSDGKKASMLGKPPGETPEALLAPSVLDALDLDLSLKAEKINLGRDELGSGKLLANISDSR